MQDLKELLSTAGVPESTIKEAVSLVGGMVEAETEKGIENSRTKNKENKVLRERTKELEALNLKANEEVLKLDTDLKAVTEDYTNTVSGYNEKEVKQILDSGITDKFTNGEAVTENIMMKKDYEVTPEGVFIGGLPAHEYIADYTEKNELSMVITQNAGTGYLPQNSTPQNEFKVTAESLGI